MNETTQPSKCKRLARRGLIALAWIVSIIALCYGVIDWRARHAWNEYRQNYEARVAPLDLKAYIPKEIPDAENFAATPFVLSWIKDWRSTNVLFDHDAWGQAHNMIYNPAQPPAARDFEDLVAWQEAFAAVRSHAQKTKDKFHSDKLDLASRAQAATAILEGMKDDEAVFDELNKASARPYARYPIVYYMENPWAILLPHLAKIKQTCLRLETRACAELATEQNEKALADVRLALYTADTVRTEPFFVSYMVRIACVHIAIHPIWEGLAEQRWTDAQLQQLQAGLESYDFLADMQLPLHTERAWGVLTADLMKKRGLGLLASFLEEMHLSDTHSFWDNEAVLNVLGRILPSGWYDREKLNYCLLADYQYRGTVDEVSKRVFPSRVAANALKLALVAKANPQTPDWGLGSPAQGPLHAIIHHEYLAGILLPSLHNFPRNVATIKTAADEAAIACALERYRLANGQFPENLRALVPRFAAHLPNDVITGEPYKYRRTDGGRFVLYSVGWNEKDDGGVSGKTMFDETAGDWGWTE
jgi:hypothetical protein